MNLPRSILPPFLVPLLSTRPPVGATVNSKYIGRNSSRLDALRAMLPDSAVQYFIDSVSGAMVASASADTLQNQRRHSPLQVAEVWRWIAQRLDISLHIKVNIKTAYKSVLFNTEAASRILPLNFTFST